MRILTITLSSFLLLLASCSSTSTNVCQTGSCHVDQSCCNNTCGKCTGGSSCKEAGCQKCTGGKNCELKHSK